MWKWIDILVDLIIKFGNFLFEFVGNFLEKDFGKLILDIVFDSGDLLYFLRGIIY